jgi:hypothetical protein
MTQSAEVILQTPQRRFSGTGIDQPYLMLHPQVAEEFHVRQG